MTTFKYTVNGNSINIQWENCFINRTDYVDFSNYISNSGYVPNSKVPKLEQIAHGHNISLSDAKSIRSVVLKDKIISKYKTIRSKISRYTAEYLIYDINVIATKYDLPPLVLLREILRKYYPAELLKNVFNGRLSSTELNKRDQAQLRIAQSVDAESHWIQGQLQRVAADNERIFANYFRGIGVDLQTEDEIAAEQISACGRAVITPDILFTQPVYIDNIRVWWMDFKNYTCTDKFILKSNIKQAEKYNLKWGPGALVYNGCILEDVKIKDTLLLSANCLKLKFRFIND